MTPRYCKRVMRYSSGFTLVELAIVLVIIGLVIGGTLGAQGLIEAAKLRSVITEFQSYTSAVENFKSKYRALPGDFDRAGLVWGYATTGGAGGTCTNPRTDQSTATGQTCNGDGNKSVGRNDNRAESLRFWQHLSLAGMIDGAYQGIDYNTTGGSWMDHYIGVNSPASDFDGGGWASYNLGTYTSADITFYDGIYGHIFELGSDLVSPGWWGPDDPLFTPKQASDIDEKLDNALPATGKVVVRSSGNCVDTATGANDDPDGDDLESVYQFTYDDAACVLIFKNAYEATY